MIDPSLLTDAIVSTLRTNTGLVDAMAGEASRIQGFHYFYGTDFKLAEAIYKLKPPAVLIVWEGTQGGNFDGYTVWKHKFGIYIRAANVAGVANPISYEHLWWLIVNGPVNNTALNIRRIQILTDSNGSPLVDLMDTPSIVHMQDEDGADFFCGRLVFPEIGDN